jgi:hypothetical protein
LQNCLTFHTDSERLALPLLRTKSLDIQFDTRIEARIQSCGC